MQRELEHNRKAHASCNCGFGENTLKARVARAPRRWPQATELWELGPAPGPGARVIWVTLGNFTRGFF